MLMLNPAVRLQSFPFSTQYSRDKAYYLSPFAQICCAACEMPLNECDYGNLIHGTNNTSL